MAKQEADFQCVKEHGRRKRNEEELLRESGEIKYKPAETPG